VARKKLPPSEVARQARRDLRLPPRKNLEWYETLTSDFSMPTWERVESQVPERIKRLVAFERQAFLIRVRVKARGGVGARPKKKDAELLVECRKQATIAEHAAMRNGDFETVEKIVTAEKARIEKAREKRITARVRGVRVEDDPFVEIGGSSITERTTGIPNRDRRNGLSGKPQSKFVGDSYIGKKNNRFVGKSTFREANHR